MSYLDYYRQNPAWATNQWQNIAPPQPSFQPQPSWGGMDYFRSAVGGLNNVNPDLYGYGMASLQNNANLSMYGTSMVEAKIQHRRAYGGLGDILVMMPQEIGAAAAYEVWRNWRYHNGILAQPLAGDVRRQREALVGLAIGESAKLMQYTRRIGDTAGQAAAAETAAIAAARIFDQGNDALVRSGGAYGSLGSSSLSGALSPVLGPTGSYGGMGGMNGMGGAGGMGGMNGMGGAGGMGGMPGMTASSTGYDPMGASLAAPPISRRRSASFGGMSPYGAAPPLASSAYAASESGMYGGGDGMLGAGGPGGLAGSLSRPVSPVYPSAGYGGAPNMSYAGSAMDANPGGALERRLAEHEINRAGRYGERAALSGLQGSPYGPDGLPLNDGVGSAYGGYDEGFGGGGGGGYRRGYDDIDGYGYGRRRHHYGGGRRALEGGIGAARYAMAGRRLGEGGLAGGGGGLAGGYY